MKALSTLCALTAVAGLAACQPASDETATADAGATAAGDAATPATSDGDSIQARAREGLWQTSASFPGGRGPTVTSRVCMDASMTALDTGTAQSAGAEGCSQNVTRIADGFSFTSRCEPTDGGVTETVGTITGDFQTAYRMEATVTTTGSPMAAMNGSTQVVTEATYQGPCPEGWRPGDVEVAGMGMRINVNDLRAQAAAGAGGG